MLPAAWIEHHRIEVVPLMLSWDGEALRNGDLPYAEFERRIAEDNSTPTTSAPSPGEYESAYRRLGDADIVVLTPPAELSVTFSNATLAAQAVDADRIRVLDSRSAAAGQGLIARAAAEAADADGDLDAVTQRVHFVAARVQLWATLERLDYLKRSGRVPAVAAYATGALDLHPVFRFVDGSPSAVGAARGARRAADRVFKAWRSSAHSADERAHVLAFHGSRADEAVALRDRALEAGADAEFVEITAAMAAHLGPGVLGLAWWWETDPPPIG